MSNTEKAELPDVELDEAESDQSLLRNRAVITVIVSVTLAVVLGVILFFCVFDGAPEKDNKLDDMPGVEVAVGADLGSELMLG